MKIVRTCCLQIVFALIAQWSVIAAIAQQPVEPVTWEIHANEVSSDTWDVEFHAKVIPGWYIYSVKHFGDMGPIPTSIIFDPVPNVTLSGPVSETGAKVLEGHDEIFDMTVKKFKGSATFTQRIQVADASIPVIGHFEYMTCNDQECIFADPVYFNLLLKEGRQEMNSLPYTVATQDFGGSNTNAVQDPVTWELRVEPKGEDRFLFIAKAIVQDGWYVYSQKNFGDMGPIPTSIGFDTLVHATPIGEPQEAGKDMIEGHDEIFDMTVRKFKHQAEFSRLLKVTETSLDITGVIDFMTCNDKECIFPDPLPFKLNIATGAVSMGLTDIAADVEVVKGPIYKLPNVDLENPVIKGDAGTVLRSSRSLWSIFILGFLGGLVALLTPCVFPMIPLTVSFFTKGSEDKAKGLRNAVSYGLFIFLIYIAFSIPFHVLGSVDPEIFNEISTNHWLNIAFFVIFILFAISFFGYFEITLPSSWVNKMDSNANKFGGMIGILFMALTLALVSFSCTGPILGSLLAGTITADGGAWQLTSGLAGFGMALALPFGLFAMFPGWLNSLPRSGSWLNTVKVVLGFVELALAVKFLSNADLVMNWGLLKREVFIGLWVVIGIGLVIYLLGKLKFPHDGPLERLGFTRIAMAVLVGAFVIYLIPGLGRGEGRNLRLLSGFPPPLFYSLYEQQSECPLGLECHHDLEEAFTIAKHENKPVMIDFTGWACVNCRKMEENVWPEPEVFNLINEKYILVSLYVDDKRELPKDDQHIYETSGGKKKQIITTGNKWATVQTETFINNSQPYYVLLSPEGELLTDPVGYTPDEEEYAGYLQRGLDAMKELGKQARR